MRANANAGANASGNAVDGDGTRASLGGGSQGSEVKEQVLRLVEKRFGAVGREARTEDVFQRYFFGGGKGQARGVGDVWLDGRTVHLPLPPLIPHLAA
jgi:hypothetical protein